jgi:hypothetical protein
VQVDERKSGVPHLNITSTSLVRVAGTLGQRDERCATRCEPTKLCRAMWSLSPCHPNPRLSPEQAPELSHNTVSVAKHDLRQDSGNGATGIERDAVAPGQPDRAEADFEFYRLRGLSPLGSFLRLQLVVGATM